MSALASRKRRARFETAAFVFDRRRRPVMVELFPERMELVLKGTRGKYALTYEVAYDVAVKRAMTAGATARRIEKKKAAALKREL